ncbi:MAG: SRPBCC family protein [Gemmatimonadetes bacterium]|nr:SRPBCC family protein [Gemmatimonadota bacterium]
MTRTRLTRIISAPIDRVFDTIADPVNYTRAVPQITKVEFLTDQRNGVGTRFRETREMRGREAATELEVTEYVVNERVRLVSRAGGTVWDSVFTVTPTEDGRTTRLDLVMEARPYRLLARVFVPLMKGVVAKAVAGDMDAVKAYLESAQ